jgi:hypothetical protein
MELVHFEKKMKSKYDFAGQNNEFQYFKPGGIYVYHGKGKGKGRGKVVPVFN